MSHNVFAFPASPWMSSGCRFGQAVIPWHHFSLHKFRGAEVNSDPLGRSFPLCNQTQVHSLLQLCGNQPSSRAALPGVSFVCFVSSKIQEQQLHRGFLFTQGETKSAFYQTPLTTSPDYYLLDQEKNPTAIDLNFAVWQFSISSAVVCYLPKILKYCCCIVCNLY